MRKVLLALALVLSLVVPVMAEVGGPCLPAGRFEVGYDVDYINRDYDFQGWTNNGGWGAPNAAEDYDLEMKSVGHYATLAYGFTDQFEGKVYLGGDDFDGEDKETAANKLTFDDNTSFSWGLGAKFTAPDVVMPNVDLTVGGQYFVSQWKNVTTATGGVNVDNAADNVDVDIDSRRWNISLILSTDYQQLTPYVGIRYSDDRVDADIKEKVAGSIGGSGTYNYEADNIFGGLVGTDIAFTNEIGGNIEVRFGDENIGVAGGVNYKF